MCQWLEDCGDGAEQRIEDPEHQADVDNQLISALESQGVVDRGKIIGLEAALVTCRRIGVAIGILMAAQKLPEDAAFNLLHEASQASHRKLRDIADDVVFTGTLG